MKSKSKFNKTPCRPLGHRVLVKIHTESEYKGIIQLLKEDECTSIKATVIEIGPTAFDGYADGEAWYKEGDTVLIIKGAGVFIDPLVHLQTDEVYKEINEVDAHTLIEA